ncbi:MipA/OmpV family protein [Colwelliaceae bacterium BS250]
MKLVGQACWLALVIPTVGFSAAGNHQLDPEDRSGNWSLGVSYAWHDSPYRGENWRTDFIPKFTYSGEQFYFDTTELGWHIIDTHNWQLDIYSNYFIQGYNDHSLFSDTGEVRPEDDPLKGMERKSALEGGLKLTRKTAWGRWSLAINHDIDNVHNGGSAYLDWSKVWHSGDWQFEPWATIGWHSSEKSDYYFGVKPDEALEDRPSYTLSDTSNVSIGAALRYTAWRQHHFSFDTAYTIFNDSVTNSPVIADRDVASASFGYRYEFDDLAYNDSGDYNFFTKNPNPWSVRVAYGCTSDTSFNSIVRLNIDCDANNTHLGSVFVSRQLSETFFSLPVEAWLTTGVARRFESPHQNDFWEGVLAFKAVYRQFPWSDRVETRLGIAEGFSYAHHVPNIETTRANERDKRTAHLLNYLDWSLDVNVADVLNIDSMKRCFFGWSVHHRSGIFASSNFYGSVDGGSNVNTLYLECEYN